MPIPFPKAVIFDLDNTLHSLLLARIRAAEVLAIHLDDPLGELTLRFLNGDKPTLVTDTLTPYLAERDNLSEDLLAQCSWLYFAVERNSLEPFVGIVELLATLHCTGVRLAVITNSKETDALDRLKTLGLLEYFTAVIAPETFGVKKPNPLVYQKTLELLGVSADEAVMIGDRLDRDVIPAREAGMRAVHVVYGSFEAGEEGAVNNAEELKNLVCSLQKT
ncbi:Phosphoglycolate phosphatase [Methanocorpusculaceae archaeon Sp1]|nr:Phosphoglycolate phosphatase [Methanocorpusculaceae archaeon Sp1]